MTEPAEPAEPAEQPKPLAWCRFAVTIATDMPAADYALVTEDLPTEGRFKVTAAGYTEADVRLVVEYTARGANGHDVRKRIVALGIDPFDIDVKKVASFDVEFGPNEDLADVVGLNADNGVLVEAVTT